MANIGCDTCPQCKGTGICDGLHNEIVCFRCEGTGLVSCDMKNWIAHGKTLRDLRVGAGVTLFDAAIAMGVQSARISAIEQGRVFNTDISYEFLNGDKHAAPRIADA